MSSEVAGAHTNGSMDQPAAGARDVNGVKLFEIATEVANRGMKSHGMRRQSIGC